ncbi:MAG: GAF and ANTAR domain-containing protein [Mycobacteriales bacterium]
MNPDVPGGVRDDHDALARQLALIARVLLSPGTVEQTLRRIVTLAVGSIDSCDEGAVCASPEGRAVAFTSEAVIDLNNLQIALTEGPRIDALAGQDCVFADDLGDDARWPTFGPAAVRAGFRSALVYRLFADQTLGALQLYAFAPDAFDEGDRAQGLIFASHAGMALAVAEEHATDQLRSDNLQAALASREIIGQAQGILMEREHLTAQQAFDLLRRASQRLNVKLSKVAQGLVDTGLVDEAPPPAPKAPLRRGAGPPQQPNGGLPPRVAER